MPRRFLIAAAIPLCIAGPAAGGDFLSAAVAVQILADGQAWTGHRPGGPAVRLTLRPDGTGRFEGPLTRETQWAIRDGAICIAFGIPLGTKCVRFERRGGAFVAHEGDAVAFILSR